MRQFGHLPDVVNILGFRSTLTARASRIDKLEMKVLVLTNIFPRKRDPFSGTYVADQVASLKSLVEIQVVAKTYKPALGLLPFFVSSAWSILTDHYDVVHAHYGFHSALVPALISSKPLVVTFHGSDALSEPLRNAMYEACQRKVIAAASHMIAVSDQIRNTLVTNLGAASGRVSVIPCGVDTSRFAPRSKKAARSELGIPPQAKVALFVGRLEARKGVDLIKRVVDRFPHVQFYFIGHGPLRWNAPNCRFVGVLSHSEIPTYLNAADVLLLPSRSEGTPVSVLEALASEVPVLCTRVGACPQLVQDGTTGMLMSRIDSDALTEALHDCFGDTTFHMAIGRHMVINQYSLAPTAARIHDVYATVLKERST